MALVIGDDNSGRLRTPLVNYFLIILNILVFIFWQRWGTDVHTTYSLAAVPGEILTGKDLVTPDEAIADPVTGEMLRLPGLPVTPVPVLLTLITSQFLHGGIAHLFGNMLFLWVFGDNIEDALGHGKYLLFYLLCGVLAGLSHVATTALLGQNLLIPSIGASGAISGVLGAYIWLYPRRGVHVWLFFLFVITVPAFVAVGLWFAFQLLNGLGTLGGQEGDGIAYAAHIGGFIAGLVLINFLKPVKRKRSSSGYR